NVLPGLASYMQAWDAFLAYEGELVQKAADDADSAYATGRTAVVVVMIVAIAFGVVTAIYVTRRVSGPVVSVVALAERAAEGELGARVDALTDDDMGKLQRAVNAMLARIGQVVGEVKTGSLALADASSQLASMSQSLSQGTSEQAASVEETTATL